MMNLPSSYRLVNNPLFYLVLLLDVVLRGISLYKSARKDQRVWFVALLIVNSMGILPLIYLFINKEIVFGTAVKSVKKIGGKKKK